MFGFNYREKGMKTALGAVAPLIHLFEISGEATPEFWNDPYVLGFVTGTALIFAKLATKGRVKGEDSGMIATSVVAQFSKQDMSLTARKLAHFASTQNEDYRRGVKNAEKCALFLYGANDFGSDPDVIDAKNLSAKIGSGLDLEPIPELVRVGGLLQQKLWYETVRKRLNLAA